MTKLKWIHVTKNRKSICVKIFSFSWPDLDYDPTVRISWKSSWECVYDHVEGMLSLCRILSNIKCCENNPFASSSLPGPLCYNYTPLRTKASRLYSLVTFCLYRTTVCTCLIVQSWLFFHIFKTKYLKT